MLKSAGATKLKFNGFIMNGVVGSPLVLNLTTEQDKDYYVKIEGSSMKGVLGEILDEKKQKKIAKEKYADEVNLEQK
jgi:hypothetical protein